MNDPRRALTTTILRRFGILILLVGVGFATMAETRKDAPKPPIVIDPVTEIAWGRLARVAFLKERPQSRDGNLAFRIEEIGRRVAAVSDRPLLPYSFVLIEGDELQGYSFPGGTVCVTEGLARLHASDDELAFALAHEVAHIVLRHQVNRRWFQEQLEEGASGDQALLESVKTAFEWNAEIEADRFGALYAVRAGYSYSSTYQALARIGANTKGKQGDATHRSFAQRVEALKGFKKNLERTVSAFKAGLAALEGGEPDEAIELFGLFVGQFPNSISGRINLGAAYLARVRLSAGTPQGLSEVLPILPDPGVVIRGVYDKNDLKLALANFETALSLHPREPLARAGAGLAYTRLGEYDKAREQLREASELEPFLADFVLCRGNIEYLSGRLDEAASFYQEALALQPGWPKAVRNLALTWERLEHQARARELWTTLLEDEELCGEALRRLRDLDAEPEETTAFQSR